MSSRNPIEIVPTLTPTLATDRPNTSTPGVLRQYRGTSQVTPEQLRPMSGNPTGEAAVADWDRQGK
jgi:hypothetical protein